MNHLFVDDADYMLRYSLDERYDSQFNGDISKQDVSHVKDMSGLFFRCPKFNGDISKWNVSNVKDMQAMFSGSLFNGDISKWDVSKLKNIQTLFHGSNFTGVNGDISKWDVSNVSKVDGEILSSKIAKDAQEKILSIWTSKNPKFSKYFHFIKFMK